MEEYENQRFKKQQSRILRSSKKRLLFKTTPFKKIVKKRSGDGVRKNLSSKFILSINQEAKFENFLSMLNLRDQSMKSLISKKKSKWTNFVKKTRPSELVNDTNLSSLTEIQDFQLSLGPDEELSTENSTKMSDELETEKISKSLVDVTALELHKLLQYPITMDSPVNINQVFENNETDIVGDDNIEECSPTFSSTPIKDSENLIRNNDDNNEVDMDSIYVENTNDHNISNQIIMNEETTEKVMRILEESMQVYDEDGQLESLKDIGRIQVSFVYEEPAQPPIMIEYIQTNENQPVNNEEQVQNMDSNNEIVVEGTANLIDIPKDIPKKSCFISDKEKQIKKKVTFKKPKKSKKTLKTSLSTERDILIQNILNSKKSVIQETIEKCDSVEISTQTITPPVNKHQNIDSQEISNKRQPIPNCKKCSLEIRTVARKIYLNILKQFEMKRERLIRFKQANKRRRSRVQDKGTTTEVVRCGTNTSPPITPEVVRFADNWTNTSPLITQKLVRFSDNCTNTSPLITPEVVRFIDNETNASIEIPNEIVADPITHISNSVSVGSQSTAISPKTNLIDGILAKARKQKKRKCNKHKVIKNLDPQIHFDTSSSENEPIVLTVTAEIHSIPKINNHLSEDNIQNDIDINEVIKKLPKNSKKEKTVKKNLEKVNRIESDDSVLSNTFYATQNKNPALVEENIPEEVVIEVSPDLPRFAPEPNVVKELIHIKMKPVSKKRKSQPKINEIYPVEQRKLVADKKIKRKDFSHQIHRTVAQYNTQCSSSTPSSEYNENTQPYESNEITSFPQLDELTLNEDLDIIPPSNKEIPRRYTRLNTKLIRKRKKKGKKLLYNKKNDIYEKNENSEQQVVFHKPVQVDKGENIVIDNNSVMHTEAILKRNTQLINKNAAHRKRKETLKRQLEIESENVIVNKSFKQRTYNANDLDKTMYSMQSSLESLSNNQANESFYSNDADEYQKIVSSTQQFVNLNHHDFVSISNLLSPIIYK